MRKTQVALAALALVASTAALADVKVYGIVDAGIASSSGKTEFYGAGNNGTTLMGFKGSEDLGGGLKAGFTLETGLNIRNGAIGDNGGGNTQFFNRGANVSLSNDTLGLTLGNQFSNVVLAALVNGATAVGGDGANIGAVVRLFGGVPGAYATSVPSSGSGVFFIPQAAQLSFNGGGFSANVMHRVIEKDANNSAYTGATVSTSFSGVNLGLGYQTAGYNTSTSDYTSTFIAANTSFGDIRVNGAYSNNSGRAAAKSNGYMLGISSPLVGALAGGLTYSKGTAAQGTMLTASFDYSLSKSTLAYLNYSQFSVAGAPSIANDGNLTITGKSLTTVGIKHSF